MVLTLSSVLIINTYGVQIINFQTALSNYVLILVIFLLRGKLSERATLSF